MPKPSPWAQKLLALIQGGNRAAAMAQIKVAPTVKDLQSLHAALDKASLLGRWPDLDAALRDNLAALAAPRLHRSP